MQEMQVSASGGTYHQDLIADNPNSLKFKTSGSQILSLNEVIPEQQGIFAGGSILLDRDERELVKKGAAVSKEEMWDLLENKRFESLKQSAVNLQGDLIYNMRCPKCTLLPPCKHYESQSDIVNDANKLLTTKKFKKYLSPRKLQGLSKAVQHMSNQHILPEDTHGSNNLYQARSAIPLNPNSMMINDQSVVQLDRNGEETYIGSQQNMGRNQDLGQKSTGSYFAQRNQRHMRNGSIGVQSTHKTLLGNAGANIMQNQQKYDTTPGMLYPTVMSPKTIKQTQFLRKGKGGCGGSPSQYDIVYQQTQNGYDQQQSASIMMPVKRNIKQPMMRIRNRTGSYDTMNATTSQLGQGSVQQLDTNHDYERIKRKQDRLAAYKEQKLQQQIEQIENQQDELRNKLLKDAEKEQQRIERGERIKQKLGIWQELKYQEDQEKKEKNKQEFERSMLREQMKQQYFEQQRMQIQEFKIMKEQAEGYLHIKNKNMRNPSQAMLKEQYQYMKNNVQKNDYSGIKTENYKQNNFSTNNKSIQNQSQEHIMTNGSQKALITDPSKQALAETLNSNANKEKQPPAVGGDDNKPFSLVQDVDDKKEEQDENEDGHEHTHSHSGSGYSDDEHEVLTQEKGKDKVADNKMKLPEGAKSNPGKVNMTEGTSEKYSEPPSHGGYTDYSQSGANKSAIDNKDKETEGFKNFNSFDKE